MRSLEQKGGKQCDRSVGIHIGTLNILDGRGNRLEMACRTLQRHGVDIALLTETKLNGRHTGMSYGYEIMSTKCSNQHQGGVALIAQSNQHWHLEGFERFGSNVVKSTLVHDDRRTTIIGAYLPPSDQNLENIRHLDKAMTNVKPENTILLGDLNINYHKPRDARADEIVDGLKTYDL